MIYKGWRIVKPQHSQSIKINIHVSTSYIMYSFDYCRRPRSQIVSFTGVKASSSRADDSKLNILNSLSYQFADTSSWNTALLGSLSFMTNTG